MARLILSMDGQVLAEYNMGKERYTIGRLPDNDVRIDNPAVSGHHALVINILNDSFLEDLNSTNGTYVNGKLIKKHALQHGDVITTGHHQLRFVDSQSAENEPDEFEKTMVITPNESMQDRVRRVKLPPLPAVNGHANGSAQGQQVLELVKTLTTLGRPGVQVAAITRRADGFYLVHVDGAEDNYPLINDSPIGPKAHRLADNDVITIAGVKMSFFSH